MSSRDDYERMYDPDRYLERRGGRPVVRNVPANDPPAEPWMPASYQLGELEPDDPAEPDSYGRDDPDAYL